ncbi:thiopurine S-methyltransferase [Castellaniella sp.]|uniref:thiopurine S-methyltransferase n=1 Tax=Castellaniella sp. TaxID=1955812 RepID=UPI00355FF325
MDNEFWLQRWQQGQTGFHQNRVMPLLQKHWPSLGLPPGSRVLVPLAGKSLDVAWLAQEGHEVLAVELSPLAVAQFFEAHRLQPTCTTAGRGTWHTAGRIRYYCGDIFDLQADVLGSCVACYDRAALIALTPELRQRYVQHVYATLPAGCQTLLLSLDYPQAQMDGPPFSVPEAEIRQLFAPRWQFDLLETRDVLAHEPKFSARGVTRMNTCVSLLTALS